MSKISFSFLLLFIPFFIFAQEPEIISGPFQGATTPNSTEIWMMASHGDEAFVDSYSSMFSNGEKHGVMPVNIIALNDSIKII